MKIPLTDEEKAKRLAYYHANKKTINANKKEYRKNNRDKINTYHQNKIKIDPLYKLRCSLRNTVREGFRNKGISKSNKTETLLVCSFAEFKTYLESKFESWMTWDNRGLYNSQPNYGWDIDHIIPLKTAKTEDDLIRLNYYTNLQPLCSYINRDVKK